MPASLKSVREDMEKSLRPTARDAGLELHLTVTAYDGGMIAINGRPLNVGPPYDAAEGWVGVFELAATYLGEMRRRVEKRKKTATSREEARA